MGKFILLILLSIFIFACNNKHSDKPSTEKKIMKNQYPLFNGINAFQYLLAQTQFGPRNPNSVGHKKCLEYLVTELSKYADQVVRQQFNEKGYNEILTLTNVFASFNKQHQKRILLIAHWDTKPHAEMETNEKNKVLPIIGANDGASGVAVLLELANILKNNPPPIGVDILLTDGEDYGSSERDGNDRLYFLGAKYFSKTKVQSYNPLFGILLDMVGDRDLQLQMEQHSMKYAPQVVDLVWSAAEEIGVSQFVQIPGELISDDHLSLNEAGIPTVDVIDFQYPYWHTLEDTPDKCSAESLEVIGKVLCYIIYTKV